MRSSRAADDEGSTPAKRRVMRPLSSSTPGTGNRGVPKLRPMSTSTPGAVPHRSGDSVSSPSVSRIASNSPGFNEIGTAALKKRYNDLVKVKN